MYRLKLGLVVGWLAFFHLISSSVQAASSGFTTDVSSTYLVDRSGQTQVSHLFELKNTTANSYVKEYSLELTGSPLTDVTASNQDAPITPKVEKLGNRTRITLTFQNDVVGEGQTRRFSIRYNSPDVAVVTGQVLETRVPGVATGSEYHDRNVTLLTPRSFGQPVRVNPTPSKISQTDNYVRSQFDHIGSQAISVFFGQTQNYNLSLAYELENKLDRTQLQDIALPPDTGWQKVIYHQLEPRPIDFKADLDGNWLATYSLKPGEKLDVTASATARLSLERDPSVYMSPPLSVYTDQQPYWPTHDSLVSQTAAKYGSVQSLYQFVVSTLEYPDSLTGFTVKRRSAEEIIKQPQASICQDFTDLFVTLLRNKGIPARRLTGYGYAQNEKLRPSLPVGDVLHAWPEFYDNNLGTWHSVDPTWENTTGGVDYFSQFDLSHIVFAINGQSSQDPAPAGAYRLPGHKDASVKVVPTTDWQTPALDLAITVKPVKWLFWQMPGRANLEIKNNTGQAWYDVAIKISPSRSDLNLTYNTSRLSILLPFAQTIIPVSVYDTTNQLQTTQLQTNVTVQDQEVSRSSQTLIRAIPAGFSQTSWQVVGLGLAAGLVTLPLVTGSLLVYRAKQNRTLRGQSQTTQTPPTVLPPSLPA